MKERRGFVSNSSSTSFLVYGVEFENCEPDKKFDFDTFKQKTISKIKSELSKGDIAEYKKKHYSRLLEEFDQITSFDDFSDSFDEILEIVESISGLEFNSGPDSDVFYLGRSPITMKDYEIVGEWKAKIRRELEEFGLTFSDNEKLNWHSECWMDG